MTHVARGGSDDAAFEWNADSPTASYLAQLMLARGETVRHLAKAVSNGQRKSVQRWLDGKTIKEPNRVKLAAYFGVAPDRFAPADHLTSVRPLLTEVEAIRRQEGLAVGTVVAEVRRLAAR